LIPKTSVLLSTYFTYPFSVGGVSTWCDILCRHLADLEFIVFAVTGNTPGTAKYSLPGNMREVIQVPLTNSWDGPYRNIGNVPVSVLDQRQDATEEIIYEKFLPWLRLFVRAVVEERSIHLELSAKTISHIWRYFQRYNWDKTWQSKSVMAAFNEGATRPYEEGLDDVHPDFRPRNDDLSLALSWMIHYLSPLNMPVPATDLVQLTNAGQIVGIISKCEYGTPLVLTEHGVFSRERYLSLSSMNGSLFVKSFLTKMTNLLCKVNYNLADVICPSSEFNRRWETYYGADPGKIEVIYNGVEVESFRPSPKRLQTKLRPTVVAAASVVPLKDIETMIRAAAIVRKSIRNLKFIVYGSLTDNPSYVKRCRTVIAELNLEDNFEFAGVKREAPDIYNEGDITVLASLTESCPYALLESMSCACPVVCTDVGDVRKIVSDFGFVVPPGDIGALAEEIVRLLRNQKLRTAVGNRGREEVLAKYRSTRMVDAYLKVYERATKVF